MENIQSARRYGDTESRRAARAEIVDRLNALALETLGLSYTALCQSEEEAQATAPPLGEATTRVETGGGAYVNGDVHVYGGDFVGRDKTETEVGPATPTTRPTVPTEGEPPTLITAALQARRLLLVWAEVPFLPPGRPTNPPSLVINRWQRDAQALSPVPWPVPQLPPLTILSLDPSDRIEAAFREADVPLNVLCAREDVINPHQHNLIKLAGDLASRSGLLFTSADVRDVPNDPDKAHLLEEARRVARGGVVLMVGDAPNKQFVQLWNELIRAYASDARHHFALGPADAHWPKDVKHLSIDVNGVLVRLADFEQVPPKAGASPLDRIDQSSKYSIHIDHAEGIAIGDGARVEAPRVDIVGDGNVVGDGSSSHVVKGNTPLAAADAGWNTAAIRDLLIAAFSDEELTPLCFDHFRPVYENLSTGMTKGQKIQLLLDYCVRQQGLEELLKRIKERTPAQYARFASRLGK
jgi:hypothetical protein